MTYFDIKYRTQDVVSVDEFIKLLKTIRKGFDIRNGLECRKNTNNFIKFPYQVMVNLDNSHYSAIGFTDFKFKTIQPTETKGENMITITGTQEDKYYDKIQQALMDAGAKLFPRSELREMSLGHLIEICICNKIDLEIITSRNPK